MEESVSTFQSAVEAEQQNGGPHKNPPQAENENTASRLNQEQGIYKAIKRRKISESHTTVVCDVSRNEVCGENRYKR